MLGLWTVLGAYIRKQARDRKYSVSMANKPSLLLACKLTGSGLQQESTEWRRVRITFPQPSDLANSYQAFCWPRLSGNLRVRELAA